MEWWLVLLLTALLALVVLVVLPYRIDLSFEARGEPSGFWAIAGGVECGPIGVTGVTARQVPPTVHLRILGRTVKTLRPTGERSASLEDVTKRVNEARGKVDVATLGEWLLTRKRRFSVQRLDVELAYSFANVVLTGQLLAATSVLAGMLPPPVRLRSAPSWEFEDRASLAIDGRVRIWPGLFAIDALRFLAKNRRVLRRRAEV